MPRGVTSRTFPPPPNGTLAPIEAALLRLLVSHEPHDTGAPAATAFRAAMRRQAEQALAAGPPAVLDYLLTRIREADPTRAGAREAILAQAWRGLPGRQS